MPDQFVVPQFIETEDKILGPISVRQFALMLGAFFIEFILFRLLSFGVFLAIGIPLLAFAIIISFVKVNGQPFHYFGLNVIQTLKKPSLRVWDKTLSTAEIKAYMKEVVEEHLPPPMRKQPISTSKLQDLTLIVNTGGVYRGEEE